MAVTPVKAPARPGALGRWLAGRRAMRWLLAGLAALLLAAALDLLHWQSLQRLNTAIGLAAGSVAAAGVAPIGVASTGAATSTAAPVNAVSSLGASAATPVPPADDGIAPALRFAQAHALAAQGHSDAALRRYAPLLADPLLGQPARFNTANLLLRQGQALQQGTQAGQALALIELAKEHYRSLLRTDPAFWPARYNLERAQRLVADPDGLDEPPAAPAAPAERSATTTRAYSPGLP